MSDETERINQKTIWREIFICFFVSVTVLVLLSFVLNALPDIGDYSYSGQTSVIPLFWFAPVFSPGLAAVIIMAILNKKRRLRIRFGLLFGLQLLGAAYVVALVIALGWIQWSILSIPILLAQGYTITAILVVPFLPLFRYGKEKVTLFLSQGGMNILIYMLSILIVALTSFITLFLRNCVYYLFGYHSSPLRDVLFSLLPSVLVFGFGIAAATFWGLMRFTEGKIAHPGLKE